ncbi:MAG: metal ABC transporter ATP-binding protein [Acidimicrobiia bacterium]
MQLVTEPAVVARDLELRYGSRVALARSSFEIPSARVTAVIGPNGSGKSTLLNGLAGLREPDAGSLEVLGSRPERIRRRIAYVLQSTKVNETLPVTVREVVAMGRYAALGLFGRFERSDRAAVDAALDGLGLTDVAGDHLSELSGGQRQRVFVAQGLVQDHDLLLLDEPFTGLDLVSASVIAEVIQRERQIGCTVVMTTHDLAEAFEADHVLLLAGRVVAAGPPERVLTAERLSAAYRSRVIDVDGRLLVDDSAHRSHGDRHVHADRGNVLGLPPQGGA